jgi:hypothetical protein
MIIDAFSHALSMAFAMGWEILWPLILGFFLSAVVQAVVSHSEMSALDRNRARARRRVLFVLLRGGGARPVLVPQGREFHRSHRL